MQLDKLNKIAVSELLNLNFFSLSISLAAQRANEIALLFENDITNSSQCGHHEYQLLSRYFDRFWPKLDEYLGGWGQVTKTQGGNRLASSKITFRVEHFDRRIELYLSFFWKVGLSENHILGFQKSLRYTNYVQNDFETHHSIRQSVQI